MSAQIVKMSEVNWNNINSQCQVAILLTDTDARDILMLHITWPPTTNNALFGISVCNEFIQTTYRLDPRAMFYTTLHAPAVTTQQLLLPAGWCKLAVC